jgi:hypothetical protein
MKLPLIFTRKWFECGTVIAFVADNTVGIRRKKKQDELARGGMSIPLSTFECQNKNTRGDHRNTTPLTQRGALTQKSKRENGHQYEA